MQFSYFQVKKIAIYKKNITFIKNVIILMKKTFLLLLVVFLSFNANAQYYNDAIGLKLTWGIGITGKHFLSENSDHAVEGSLDIQRDGFILNSFYEYHIEAFKTDGLRWYFGAGPYVGIWGDSNPWKTIMTKHQFVAGGAAIMGIEYTLEYFPINLSMDLQPRYNFGGHKLFWAYGSIAIKYTFKPKEEEEMN